MYWVQTNFNLNNIIEVDALIEDCKEKGIEQIIIGNEGSFQWLDIEKKKREAYPELKIIYAIYKKGEKESVLWVMKNNVLLSAAMLEKAYEEGDLGKLNREDVIPFLLPNEKQTPEEFKERYKLLHQSLGNVYIGETIENVQYVKALNLKSANKTFKLNRVRFLEPSDKEITDIRRMINGEDGPDSSYETILKPESFVDVSYLKTKEYLSGIGSELHIGENKKMELWDDDKFKHLSLPNNWDKFFDKQIDLPTNNRELQKIYLLCINSGKGFNARYKGSDKYEEALLRLKKELRIVIDGGFYDYFLIIEDLCNYATDKNIRINQRGSVVASLLAYCLYITNIDPLEYDLKFERFLNPHRSNKPDIDIDVPSSKLPIFVEYFREKYGENNVSKIMSFNNFGFKNALADVRKRKGIEERLETWIPKGIKDMDQFWESSEGEYTIERFMKAGYRQLTVDARKMQNSPKSVSIQPASLIIGEGVANVPTVIRDGERVVQLTSDNDTLEELGFYKIDVLPSKVLESLEDAWDLVGEEARGKFNQNDEKTFELLSKGHKDFIFQLKSYGIKKVFEQIKPKNMNEIMDGLALFRPGAKEGLEEYVKNKNSKNINNRDGILSNEPLLRVVEETNRILLYQEQVMQMATAWAGYSVEESDVLRDIVSKKRVEEMERERRKFLRKSKEKNRDEKQTNEVFALIEKFGKYGFNKPHAISYAVITYETAYIKANHTKEFFVAELNNSIKNYKKITSIGYDLKRFGIKLLEVDYDKSGEYFEIVPEGIRYGLLGVKGLAKKEIERILEERK